MKKITFSFLAIALAGFSAKAQITITSADMPVIGNNFAIANDSTNTTIGPGAKGAAVVWNFSTLLPQSVDSIKVVATGSTPYGAMYPAANEAFMAHIHGNSKDAYEYVNSGGSALSLVGLAYYNSAAYPSPAYIFYKYNPIWSFVALPATYKSNWSGKYRSVMKEYNNPSSGYDSLGIIENGTYHDTIDGWGNLTTPFASSVSTLRNKHTESDVDSTIVHIVAGGWITVSVAKAWNNYYAWYGGGYHYSLVQIGMDSTWTKITQTQWMKSAVTGINELSDNNSTTLVYPNPANDVVNIKMSNPSEAASGLIMDITGKQIGRVEFVNGLASVNTTYFASGMYIYEVLDKSGNVLDHGKFSVVR
jgi:hypothetical protein